MLEKGLCYCCIKFGGIWYGMVWYGIKFGAPSLKNGRFIAISNLVMFGIVGYSLVYYGMV